jgi:hypothetical protein
MGILKLKYDPPALNNHGVSLLTSEYDRFDASLLGFKEEPLVKASLEGLAAVFDLADFTSFCNEPGYDSVVPEYLNKFSKWLFETIAEASVQSREGPKIILRGPLPFYAKFLGDGVLFLWDISDSSPGSIGSIILILRRVCEDYEKAFLLRFQKSLGGEIKLPAKLRCGIARGPIISICAKQDYVGQCINIAARLQKLESFSSASQRVKIFSFALWKIGFFDLRPYFGEKIEDFKLIFPNVRGFREKEPVFVLYQGIQKINNRREETFAMAIRLTHVAKYLL